jgi:hypothetical protein
VAFDGQDYFWTKIPTPGATNIISSTELEKKEKNLSSNNPKPVIEQIQKPSEILAQTNDFTTQNPSTSSINNLLTQSPQNTPQNTQPASLIQKTQSNQKANLTLILSIIISASLLTSWFLIKFKNKAKSIDIPS